MLKGVPASTFMNTMFFQRYALGVACTYCHVDGEWDRDDKPAKTKARQMMQMVLDLNRNTFHDAKAVNCVTCHRGATIPQSGNVEGVRLTFDQMLTPRRSAATPPPPPDLPSVQAVIERYLAALGGRDKLASMPHTVTQGTLFTAEGRAIPYEESYASSPNRWSYIQHFGGALGDWSRGFDGSTAWIKDNRGVTVQTGQARGRMAMTAALQTGLGIGDVYSDMTVVGADTVAGTPVVVVSGRATLTGQTERLYFDTASGLLLRRSMIAEGVFGGFTTDVYYESYRMLDGIMMPLLVSEFSPDFGSVRRLRTVTHGDAPDPAIFVKPEK